MISLRKRIQSYGIISMQRTKKILLGIINNIVNVGVFRRTTNANCTICDKCVHQSRIINRDGMYSMDNNVRKG